jgi:cytochrome b5-like protein
MESIREEHVLAQASVANPLVVLDGQVVDLSGFLEHHPGGSAVLLAHLGRDVSADFHHVTAHARDGVVRGISQRVVADVDHADPSPTMASARRLVDHIRLVLNSFAAQFDPDRNPAQNLIYTGQLYSHFVGDHLPAFLDAIHGLTRTEIDPVTLRHLDHIFLATQKQIEVALISANTNITEAFTYHIESRCTTLLEDLLAVGAGTVELLRTTADPAFIRQQLGKASSLAKEWAHDEYDFIVGAQPGHPEAGTAQEPRAGVLRAGGPVRRR